MLTKRQSQHSVQRTALSLAVLFTIGSVVNPCTVATEGYIAGQLGALMKGELGSVEQSGGGLVIQPNRIGNLSLSTSPLYGVKVGYFLSNGLSWLGGETEFYRTSPNIVAQTVPNLTLSGTQQVSPPIRIDVSTLAFNLMIRYPHEWIQPYAGVGLGLFWAQTSNSFLASGYSSFSPGLNLLAGVKVFPTKSVAVFSEYKYNQTTLDFPNAGNLGMGLKADYHPQQIVIGIAYHFR